MNMRIKKAWHDIHGRKYIDLEDEDERVFHVKVPFRYNRVSGCTVEGHIPIQDLSVGTCVRADFKKVVWDGLEHYVLQRICPLPGTEKPSREVQTLPEN